MLELDKISTDTYEFSPVLPTGEIVTKAKITVRSDSHPKVKEVSRTLLLQGEQRRAAAKRRGKKTNEDALTEDDLEYLESAGITRAVSRVASMIGISEGGKEVGSDEQLIATVLKKYDWLLTQVMENAADAVNFCS